MKNQENIKLKRLAGSVGDFIRYWGFRRIHGQIWTVVYLSKNPVSGVELTKILQVSKALVSPALKDLESYRLITRLPGDLKTKRYTANADVFAVIKNILETREQVLLTKASKHFFDLSGEQNLNLEESRVDSLSVMIDSANFLLMSLLSSVGKDQLLPICETKKVSH